MCKWYALLSDAVVRPYERKGYCSFAVFDVPEEEHASEVVPAFRYASKRKFLMHHMSRMSMGSELGMRHVEMVELLALYSGLIWLRDRNVLNQDTNLVAFTDSLAVVSSYNKHRTLQEERRCSKRSEVWPDLPESGAFMVKYSNLCFSQAFRMMSRILDSLQETCGFDSYKNLVVEHVKGKKVKKSILGH